MHKLKTNVQCCVRKPLVYAPKLEIDASQHLQTTFQTARSFLTLQMWDKVSLLRPRVQLTRALFPGSHGQAPSNQRRLREGPRAGYPRSSAPRGLRISGAPAPASSPAPPVPPHTRLLHPSPTPPPPTLGSQPGADTRAAQAALPRCRAKVTERPGNTRAGPAPLRRMDTVTPSVLCIAPRTPPRSPQKPALLPALKSCQGRRLSERPTREPYLRRVLAGLRMLKGWQSPAPPGVGPAPPGVGPATHRNHPLLFSH